MRLYAICLYLLSLNIIPSRFIQAGVCLYIWHSFFIHLSIDISLISLTVPNEFTQICIFSNKILLQEVYIVILKHFYH